MSFLFILSYPLTTLSIGSKLYFNIIFIILVVTCIVRVKRLKLKLEKRHFIFFVLLVVFYMLVSIRYTLGEQMGDNVYVFIQVMKNINTNILNNFDFNNGLSYDYVFINPTKSFISFYHFFLLLTT